MNKLLLNGILMALFVVAFASCQYKFIVEPVPTPPAPGDSTSFSLDIAPIFTDQGCTSCHSTGGQSPDLTADNAFNSITSSGLVNTELPADSRIYYYPLPDGNHYVKYTAQQATLILYWIEEGAKNN